MNNIFIPNDPLLYNMQQNNNFQQMYEQKLMRDREILDKQYNDYMNQMKVEDKIGTLNNSLRKLSPEMKDALMEDKDFVALNQTLQDIVQEELMKLVKGTLNQNPQVTQNIDRQMQIIDDMVQKSTEADRKNMAEINDYLKNYSNMTFDEYKKLKQDK